MSGRRPTPLQPDDANGRVLPDACVRSWREEGFALVDGLLPTDAVDALARDAAEVFPEPGSDASDPIRGFGSGGRFVFPSESAAANRVTLHPRLLGAVAQLLGVPVRELRLTQSDVWAKYGRGDDRRGPYDNADQRIHVDYPNHTLTHPPRWDEPDAVEILLYLSDEADTGGPTVVVPRRGADDPAYPWPITRIPGVATLPWMNDRSHAEAALAERDPALAAWRAEQLYAREEPAHFGVGTVLLYRHDTWHRGTPIREGTRRFAMNLTFRKATSEWISTLHVGWAWAAYRGVLPQLLADVSIDARCVLGFPAPGDRYWNEETIAAIRERYGPLGMELAPYEDALSRSSG